MAQGFKKDLINKTQGKPSSRLRIFETISNLPELETPVKEIPVISLEEGETFSITTRSNSSKCHSTSGSQRSRSASMDEDHGLESVEDSDIESENSWIIESATELLE